MWNCLSIYWGLKLHKNPTKARIIIPHPSVASVNLWLIQMKQHNNTHIISWLKKFFWKQFEIFFTFLDVTDEFIKFSFLTILHTCMCMHILMCIMYLYMNIYVCMCVICLYMYLLQRDFVGVFEYTFARKVSFRMFSV